MFKHQQAYDGTKVYRLPIGLAVESLTPAQMEAA
jgi:hypothetical protein